MTPMPPPPATTSAADDDKDERTSALVGTLSQENLRNLLVLFFRSESERAKRFEATLNMQRRTVETIAEMIRKLEANMPLEAFPNQTAGGPLAQLQQADTSTSSDNTRKRGRGERATNEAARAARPSWDETERQRPE